MTVPPIEAEPASPRHAAHNSGLRPKPTVLVLGATGFLGQALVQRLLQDGITLRALVRPGNAGGGGGGGGGTERARALVQQGVEVVEGDLTETTALTAALQGVQHVFHLARGTGPTWADYVQHDVEPTRRLALLCGARGIQLHYLSSIAIYDGGRAGEVITEHTTPSAASMRLNAYARAKVANERLLADLHRSQALKVVVFRPGIVIGHGGNPRHPGVGAWPNDRLCRPWGGGHHPLPFVLVEDCADALVRAMQVPGIAGESFNLIGPAELSGNAYLDALAQHTGQPITRAPRPAWRLFAQSVAKWGLQRLRLRSAHPVQPTPSYRYCAGLSCRAHYAADKARQRLGWTPAADTRRLIEQGIHAALTDPTTRGGLIDPLPRAAVAA